MASTLTADDRAQLSRLWSELTTAIRIVERLLGDDDPTGLRYDRGDDEEQPGPVPPVPPGVDGLSITGRPARRPTNSPAGYASPQDRARRCQPAGGELGEAGTPTPASPSRGGERP